MSVLRGASMTPISEEEARALLAMGIEVWWKLTGTHDLYCHTYHITSYPSPRSYYIRAEHNG